MSSTLREFLKMLFVAMLLSVMAAYLVPFGAKQVREASARGYVDVGAKRVGHTEYLWKARHTSSEQPWRFYASLVRWISAPLFLIMAAALAWLQLFVLLGTGRTRLVGHARTAGLCFGALAALAAVCTLFFWIPFR
jgi:hypothetical protein